ncbi:MAG TPA: hypothetical protein DEB40_14745 [Elusimicrobia bacterium]|nr:hypothetical protein [Elusimicrobiota bacterium]HBT62993.1 hypothetical protein [Elusimicrobiota bacterium]
MKRNRAESFLLSIACTLMLWPRIAPSHDGLALAGAVAGIEEHVRGELGSQIRFMSQAGWAVASGPAAGQLAAGAPSVPASVMVEPGLKDALASLASIMKSTGTDVKLSVTMAATLGIVTTEEIPARQFKVGELSKRHTISTFCKGEEVYLTFLTRNETQGIFFVATVRSGLLRVVLLEKGQQPRELPVAGAQFEQQISFWREHFDALGLFPPKMSS